MPAKANLSLALGAVNLAGACFFLWHYLAVLGDSSVWTALGPAQPIISFALFVTLAISLLYTLPSSFPIRQSIPFIGRKFIPFPMVFIFCVVELALFTWSFRLFANHVHGNEPGYWMWFLHAFTPFISLSMIGGGFGAIMVMTLLPVFGAGCAALGAFYASLVASGNAAAVVLISCLLKVVFVLVVPFSGMLGGHVISS